MYNNSIIASFLIISTAVIGFSSCARKAISNPPLTLQENIAVERDNDGEYLIKFNKKGKWVIYTSEQYNQMNWTEPLIEFEGDKIKFKQFSKSKRIYFGIVDANGKRIIVSERRLNMKGTPNFRDIGGLMTKDGRMVNWGQIYRSSNLSKLNSSDMTYMQNLNIKNVADFRYSSEIEEDPDRLPIGAKYHHFPIGGAEGLFYQDLKRRVLKEKLRRKEAKKEFVKVMEMFAEDGANDFKPVMDLLVNTTADQTPLLYHCSGGKDRTGYMTMIILSTLGVEKEEIRAEYLMSNYYRYKANKKTARKGRLLIDAETLKYILVVQDEYFDAVFKVIEEYGGIEAYLLKKYEITPEIRQAMIEKYTVDLNEVDQDNETLENLINN